MLEIGTGSGYQAAVLARLGARVATIEIVTRLGDGFLGGPDGAPLDAMARCAIRRIRFGGHGVATSAVDSDSQSQ